MTYEEVKSRIYLHGKTMTEDEALLILDALEKQILKKYKTNEFGDYVCPSCGIDIPRSIYNVSRMSTTVIAGCPFCLQAIDWSSEE